MSRPLLAAVFATTLAHCAVPAGALTLLEACDPSRWSTIEGPAPDVPFLGTAERRWLPARQGELPDLAVRARALDIASAMGELTDLAPAHPGELPDRVARLEELPPARGAPSLPAAGDVLSLAAPARSYDIAGAGDLPDLVAAPPSLDLGARSGPILEELRVCTPALVLATSPCRLPARADRGERPWR